MSGEPDMDGSNQEIVVSKTEFSSILCSSEAVTSTHGLLAPKHIVDSTH